jgi:hypothetical protein
MIFIAAGLPRRCKAVKRAASMLQSFPASMLRYFAAATRPGK